MNKILLKSFFKYNEDRVTGVINNLITTMTYEEFRRLGRYSSFGVYANFEHRIIGTLSLSELFPKYDFKKTREVFNKYLEKSRSSNESLEYFELRDDIKDNLFI